MLLFTLQNVLFAIDIPKSDIAVEIGDSSNYKFFAGAATTGVIRIPFSNGEELGDYQIEVGKLSGDFFSGNDGVSYKAAKNPLLNSATQTFGLRFNKQKMEKEVPFIISLGGEKILAPGTYVADIPIKVSRGDDVVLDKVITAFFNVEEQLEARLFMDGSVFDEENIAVLFGQVEGRAEKELFLSVRANTDVKISVSSQNNGRLILNGEEDKFTPYYIPYTLQSRGEEISLVTRTTLLTEKFNPNMAEISTNIKLLLHPDMKKNFSGKYRDRICITITPL